MYVCLNMPSTLSPPPSPLYPPPSGASVPVCVFLSLCLPLFISLSLSFFLSLPLSLSPSLFHSLSFSLSLCLSVSLFLCQSLIPPTLSSPPLWCLSASCPFTLPLNPSSVSKHKKIYQNKQGTDISTKKMRACMCTCMHVCLFVSIRYESCTQILSKFVGIICHRFNDVITETFPLHAIIRPRNV